MSFKILLISLSLTICITAGSAENWPKYRRDYANSGHSAETGTLANGVTTVNSSNISSLHLKWSHNLGGKISGTPAVVNGVVYVGTWGGVVYALNAVTGGTIWSHNLCGCRIAGSPMVINGVVYIGAANARLYALNASTGATIWSTLLTSQTAAEIWSSPAVSNGLVFVGVASHADSPCVKGAVYGINASTGHIVWTFNTVNQATCPTGAGTCTGAGVWSSAALDVPANLLYIGTGNPGSSCQPASANATLWPDSVLALNMSTGQLVGFFKAIANDTTDLDFGSSPVLLTTGSTGSCAGTSGARGWVAEASKNGYFYFLNRGANIGGGPMPLYVGGGPVASPAFLSYCSSAGVANKLYLPKLNHYFQGVTQSGSGGLSKPFSTYVSAYLMYSAPAIVNNVVFFGSQDFKLHAATTGGALIWSFTTGGRVNSGPAVSNGRIYFGSEDYHLYCLSVNAK